MYETDIALPAHPLTGLAALGFRRDGSPIWPVLGAAEPGDPDDGTSDDPAPDGEGDPAGADALGDPGKKALDDMKGRWHSERDRRKALEAELADLKKPKPADGDGGKDRESLLAELRNEVAADQLRERARDKIEARAARLFKDPEDALLRLGANVDQFIDGKQVDLDAIDDALSDLLKKRPDFGVTQGEPKRYTGSSDGGPKPAGKQQLTREDLKGMTPDAILAAKAEGRMNKILGIT